jgi:hypothetical protein
VANEIRRGGEPLPDIALPAQAWPPDEGQHVATEAQEAPTGQCAGHDDAEP